MGGESGVFLNVHEQYRDVVYLYSIREECFNKAVWHKPQASAALLEKKIKNINSTLLKKTVIFKWVCRYVVMSKHLHII